MDGNIKSRIFMRGTVKNAKAEELLELIKAEREVEEIGIKNQVPSTLTKRPLLPAIKAEEEEDGSSRHHAELIHAETIASFVHNVPVKNTNSKFVWRNWDFEDSDVNSSWKTRSKNRRLSGESFAVISKDYLPHNNSGSSFEIAPKNLPPLLSRRSSKERYERPGCPQPPRTPPFT